MLKPDRNSETNFSGPKTHRIFVSGMLPFVAYVPWQLSVSCQGLLWQSSGGPWQTLLPMQGVRSQSLVREIRPHMLHGMAKKREKSKHSFLKGEMSKKKKNSEYICCLALEEVKA